MAEVSFRKVMLLQVANTSAESFAWSFIYIQAKLAGRSEADLALFFMVMYGMAALLIPPLGRPLHVGRSMMAGLGIRCVALTIVIGVASFANLLIAGALNGAFIVLFWIPWNIAFLRTTSDANRAGRSTVQFALFALTGALLPLAGAYAIGLSSYSVVLLVSVGLLAAGAVAAATSGWGPPVHYDIARAFRRGGRVAPLPYAEGLWQGVFWLVTQVGTLRLIDRVGEFGALLALLGVMAGVASVLAGRWSDRTRDRRLPLLISASGLAVATALLTLTTGDLAAWSLMLATVNFFSYMMMGFTFTLMAELGPGFEDSMALREFMLNAGRVTGGAVVALALVALGGDLGWPIAIASLSIVAMLLGYLRALARPAAGAHPHVAVPPGL